MRDILFRGKRIDNGEWAEGDICRSAQQIYIHPNHNSFRVTKAGLSKLLVMHDINPDTVGQYTGLTDKNGKKIFEGDVMEFDAYGFHYKGVVSFAGGNFYINCNCPDAFPFLDDAIKRHDAIYVGNIHDNTELMEGE